VGDLRRLIVFDLDGTLIDSRADLASAANALIAERGGTRLAEDAIGRMVGEGAAVLVARALAAAGLAVDQASLPRFLELYDERLLATTRPYPGIFEALAALSSIGPIAVLTNKPLAPTRRLLDELDLARFVAATIGGDSDFPRKPDPASLVHLTRQFAVACHQTVMVGDSWIDGETARRAATRFCLARYGFGSVGFPAGDLAPGGVFVDAASELPRAIATLFDIS
jgi:phosphoglycolate phosphatase